MATEVVKGPFAYSLERRIQTLACPAEGRVLRIHWKRITFLLQCLIILPVASFLMTKVIHRNASPWWNADQAPVSCRAWKLAPPCPRFLVAIRTSSHFSLAVPGRFWELHASMLECDDLQLRGPNKAISIVQAKKSHEAEERKLNVRLESGWEAFFRGNTLKVGDLLEFFLVGNSRFTVDLVERIEEY